MQPYKVECDGNAVEHKNTWLAQDVYVARKKAGMPVHDDTLDHPLVGRYLIRREDGKRYIVKRASRQHIWGWFVVFLIEDDRQSGGVIYWENISSNDAGVVAAVNRAQSRYLVL